MRKNTSARRKVIVITLSLLACVAMSKSESANLRVGIFSEDGFPDGMGVRPAIWYQDELKRLGCTPVVLNGEDMSNAERLNRKALDVLILPNGGSIPYEAAYLIPKFMTEGGHLVTTRLPMTGYKSDPSKPSKWTEKAQISSREKYPMDLQIRFLSWKSAQRSLKAELKVNTNLPASVRTCLPALADTLNASMGLPDKWNMFVHGQVGGKREIRDFDGSGGENMETAGNIILPAYCLPSGEPTDFLGYRYHNNYYNGATLVHFGQVGEALMKGDKAGDVLQSCLRLCEEKYPGEQSAEWYERLIKTQRQVSEYGRIFVDAYYKVRDGLTAALYAGDREAYAVMQKKMRELMDGLEAVMNEKQTLDKLLYAATDYEKQDLRRKALLEKIAAEEKKCAEAKVSTAGLPFAIKEPEKVKIRHALGGMPIEAGVSSSPGLYGIRTDTLQTMKELGCDVWFCPWFLNNDPSAKALMEGIRGLDIWDWNRGPLGSLSQPEYKLVISRQGSLDLFTGKVEETPRETRQPEKLEKLIKEFIEQRRAYPVMRYVGGGAESALHLKYWGEEACAEYIEHLRGKYGEISRLNERWLTAYTNFNDIKLITRQPETGTEHANWEDWRRFRERQFFKANETVYKLFKKYAPNILYGSIISTGCRNGPMFGVDFYELTKAQDISSLDGTALPVSQEWTYLDLIAEGKNVWTAEWGKFYNPPADILMGRKGLSKQLWQEVSGGHIGINCWFWRCPGFSGNYVDTTGLPTLYGWELKQLVSDFRKIEHILLDGKRVDPEIRILFSNTSRCHDQCWKPHGVSSFSLHLSAVDDLYGRFAKLQFAARVLDEGALRDGTDLSKCRLLIAPQAQYLSQEIQDKLLDYAQNGGCLVMEGWSGKYDNYGNSSNNMFKALGVVPGMARTKEVQLKDGVLYTARDKKNQELFYAPVAVEGGKTILKYASDEPALMSKELEKGKIIVSGLPFSVEQIGIGLIMEELFKEAGLTPKYQCDDEKLVLREWEYENELYLICAYPEGKEPAKRFLLKIRGEWEVEDYMLGLKIPVEQDGAYTTFDGVILSPGGRVYRLRSTGRQKKADEDRKVAVKSVKSEKNDKSLQSEQSGSLPYKGELQVQNGEIMLGGYKFQVAVINSGGGWNEKGRVFLTVRRGEEERMQELKIGSDALFVFRDEALQVKCENHSYVYPEGATVAIETVERPKIKSACGITTNGVAWELSNGMVSLKVLPDEGGKIVELKTWPEGINHVAEGGIKEIDGGYPGNLMNQHFVVKSETAMPEECKIVLEMGKAVNGLKERKEIALKKNMAGVGIRLELMNDDDAIWKGMFRVHPELNVGGMADENDVFYAPEKDGIAMIQYFPGERCLNPVAGWTACCDARERLAYVSAFSLDEVKTVYLYFDENFYNIELWSDKGAQLKKGESLQLNHEIYMVKGVSGVEGYGKGWAGNLIMPAEKWPLDKKMKLVLEIGNAWLEKQSARVRVVLMSARKEVRVYYDAQADVSYESALKKEIDAGFEGLAEGEYELEARVTMDTAQILTIRKKIALLGKKLAEDRAACLAYQQRLDEYMKDLSRRSSLAKGDKNFTLDQKFNANRILEELKAAVEQQDDETIRQKREELERILLPGGK